MKYKEKKLWLGMLYFLLMAFEVEWLMKHTSLATL